MAQDFKQQLNGLNTRELRSRFAKACGNGETALVSYMLDDAEINNVLKDAYHNLGFSLACLNGELDIVKNMFNNYEKLNIQKASGLNGGVPSKNADEIINFLLDDEKYPLDFTSALQQAVSYGRVEIVKLILTNKKIVEENKNNKESNVITIDGNLVSLDSLLIYASEHNHLDMVKFVLKDKDLNKHANIHTENDIVLNMACHNGNLELVKLLLAEGADIHNQEDSPLLNACKESRRVFGKAQHMEVIKYLTTSAELSEHSNINAQNGYAVTLAFENDDAELLKFFLEEPSFKGQIDIYQHLNELKQIHSNFWDDFEYENEDDTNSYDGESYNAEVVKYLVSEYGIVSTEPKINNDIEEMIKDMPSLQAIYEKAYLKAKLNEDLNCNANNGNKPKL
jgi:ankyrin repeat protein